MALLQPGPRRPTRAVRDAMSAWATSVASALSHRWFKFAFGLLVVGGLMAWGAAPSRAVVHHPIATPLASVSASPSSVASVPMPTPQPIAQSPPTIIAQTEGEAICINDANPETLRRLPGVGEKRAKAIVELRTRLGKFKRPEDLLRIKGLGRKRLAKIRPLLRFACEPVAPPVGDASPTQ